MENELLYAYCYLTDLITSIKAGSADLCKKTNAGYWNNNVAHCHNFPLNCFDPLRILKLLTGGCL